MGFAIVVGRVLHHPFCLRHPGSTFGPPPGLDKQPCLCGVGHGKDSSWIKDVVNMCSDIRIYSIRLIQMQYKPDEEVIICLDRFLHMRSRGHVTFIEHAAVAHNNNALSRDMMSSNNTTLGISPQEIPGRPQALDHPDPDPRTRCLTSIFHVPGVARFVDKLSCPPRPSIA